MVKGVIFLHHRGSHDKYLDQFSQELQTKFPKLVEIVKFSTPSDIVRAVRARTVRPKGIASQRASLLLKRAQKRNKPPGATYFTRGPRKRTI